jgi:Mg2+ and Co2+ transporter CorA
MRKIFRIVKFISALIIFATVITGFGLNVITAPNTPNGIMYLFAGIFIALLCIRRGHLQGTEK